MRQSLFKQQLYAFTFSGTLSNMKR